MNQVFYLTVDYFYDSKMPLLYNVILDNVALYNIVDDIMWYYIIYYIVVYNIV